MHLDLDHKELDKELDKNIVYKYISHYICNYACLMTLNEVFHERKVRVLHNSYLAPMVGRTVLHLASYAIPSYRNHNRTK
jgi:DNA-binding GntR family transcriptional regulator